jgi:pseudomonalisin
MNLLLLFASKRLLSVATLAVLFLSSFSLAQQSSVGQQLQSLPLITQPIDESRLTVLKGNTHALARPQFDLGTAPATLPMQRMLLVLKRSAEQESALRKLLDDQQDKHSPDYHKWFTPEEFGKEFGPTDADMQTISSWLQSHGFQVGTSKGRTVLEFSGSASQVQEAFHTAIHKYIVKGEQHWANAGDLAIPTALTPAVAGVLTLHNFLKRPAIHLSEERLPAKFKQGSRPQFTSSGGSHALTPEDYAVIYNGTQTALNGIDGTAIAIAVVARSDLFNNGQDVSDFRNVFGLPTGTVNTVLDGADPGDLGGDDEAEATLDASWSGALATGAVIDFVVSASTNSTDGTDLSELYIIENNLGNVMTESFSTCEAGLTLADAQGISLLAEQAAAQGITYLLATGDTGAAGCDNLGETTAAGPVSVSGLASTPFTVAVGGTLFDENGQDATYWGTTNDASLGSALSYIPEDVWNEACTTQCQPGQPPLAAGGGGASTFFPKPSWQFGVSGIPNDSHRDLPDVSLTAAGHDPYLLCLEGSCVPDAQNNIFFEGVEGTSASTPSFAGIIALVDEKMSQLPAPDNSPRQGQADYVLYPLAAAQQTSGTEMQCLHHARAEYGLCLQRRYGRK